MEENNKTLKLTGLNQEEVEELIEIFSSSTLGVFIPEHLSTDLKSLLTREQISIHYDTINNKDHIIRF